MKVVSLKKKDALPRIAQAILKGNVVAFPTDTVYGFLALATHKKAVQSMFQIKARNRNKHFPLFVSGLDMAKKVAIIGKRQAQFLKSHWPGSYTLVLARNPRYARSLYGIDRHTVALRIPKFKPLRSLLKSISLPLAQTSVNISGKASLHDPQEIIEQFKNRKHKPFLVVDGGMLNGKSSTIIDLTSYPFRTVRP